MKEGAYGEQCKVCSLWVAGHNRLDDGACQTCVIGRLEADNARLRELVKELIDPEPGNCRHCEPVVVGTNEGTNHFRHAESCTIKKLEAQLALNKE